MHRVRLGRKTISFLMLIGVATAGTVGLAGLKSCVEHAVDKRIAAAASRRGFVAQVAAVSAGFSPLLTLEGIVVANPAHRVRLEIGKVRVAIRPWALGLGGPAWRVYLGSSQLSLPGGARLDVQPSSWDLVHTDRAIRMRRSDSKGERVAVEWQECAAGRMLELHLQSVDLARVLRIQVGDKLLASPGRVDLDARIEGPALTGDQRVRLHARAQGVQLALLPVNGEAGHGSTVEPPNSRGAGAPTNVEIDLAAALGRGSVTLSMKRLRMLVGKATISGKGVLRGGSSDPALDLAFSVEHVDLAELLAMAGLELPAGASELGIASADARIAGRMQDPSSFSVSHHLKFIPPSRRLPAIERLRGPFVHEVTLPDGKRRRITLAPESPDFISFTDVPPLFLRALLLSEDAGFYGHNGFDLNEVPVAMATNWQRGTNARGASTITQQLAKNLFLSREKSFGRKLQELPIALLLETTLSKQRVLEIYLNIIEWGPGIYGLRPASRHYFAKEPAELTTKEMAFLVALIPGPIKYQRSFADGALSPSFETLVTGVLAKLRSVDAITEEEYQAALAETLNLQREDDGKEASDAPALEQEPTTGRTQ